MSDKIDFLYLFTKVITGKKIRYVNINFNYYWDSLICMN